MKQQKQQRGSVEVVIITILAVVFIGALGFIFWQNVINKDSGDQASVQDTSRDNDSESKGSTSDVPDEIDMKSLNLTKWGVTLPIDAPEVSVRFVDQFDGYYDAVAVIDGCFSSMPQPVTVGRITRWSKSNPEPGFENVTPAATVGDYNYSFTPPQQACGDPNTAEGQKANSKQEALSNKVRVSLEDLE